MHRLALSALLLTSFAASLVHAQEASICTSLCNSERRQCLKDALSATREDESPLIEIEDKNPHARVVSRIQGQPEPARVAQRSDFERRRQERSRVCETSYRSCNRACAPKFTKKQQ